MKINNPNKIHEENKYDREFEENARKQFIKDNNFYKTYIFQRFISKIDPIMNEYNNTMYGSLEVKNYYITLKRDIHNNIIRVK